MTLFLEDMLLDIETKLLEIRIPVVVEVIEHSAEKSKTDKSWRCYYGSPGIRRVDSKGL